MQFTFPLSPPPTYLPTYLPPYPGPIRPRLLGRPRRPRVRHPPLRDADPTGAGVVEAELDG